jgi:hypothetical protein
VASVGAEGDTATRSLHDSRLSTAEGDVMPDMSDPPTVTEAVAVIQAVETYWHRSHPGLTLFARDLPAAIDELAAAIERLRAVIRE